MSTSELATLAERPGATLFKWLPVGTRFVFNRDDAERPHAVLIRTARGYRHEVGGREWRTGACAACYRLEARP